MRKENRKHARYEEIGRVSSPEITVLPGVLDDISISGCKVHFPNPVNYDEEKEYSVKINLSSAGCVKSMDFICQPQWINIKESETEIGFKFLRSPGTPVLNDFIQELEKKSKDDVDITNLILDEGVSFI